MTEPSDLTTLNVFASILIACIIAFICYRIGVNKTTKIMKHKADDEINEQKKRWENEKKELTEKQIKLQNKEKDAVQVVKKDYYGTPIPIKELKKMFPSDSIEGLGNADIKFIRLRDAKVKLCIATSAPIEKGKFYEISVEEEVKVVETT